MSTPCRSGIRIGRRGARPLAGCALAMALMGATPEPDFQELDEVEVTAKVPWPLEDYLEYARYDSVVLSPDGTHLAMGWGEENYQRRLSVFEWPSMNLVSSKLLPMYFGITGLRWLDDRRLLIEPDWPLPGLRRVRSQVGTVLVRNIDGSALLALHPVAAGTVNAFESQRILEEAAKRISPERVTNAFGPLRVVAARPGGKDHLLFQTLWNGRGSDAEYYFGVFRLDMASRQQTRLAALPLRGGEVITGGEHRVALVAGVNDADESVVYYLPKGAGTNVEDWQLRVRTRSGERGLVPVAWTGDDEEYYALDGRDLPTRAVVVWNARNNTRRLLYRDPEVDMDAAWFDPAGKPWMFSGLGRNYWYPDSAHPLARLHRSMVQQLPRDHVEILNATDNLSMAVVRVSSGKRPPVFMVVDVRTGHSLSTVIQPYPKLRGRRLAPVEGIQFKARDGLEIRGYLTTPLDPKGEPRHGVPLLVIAHNGPRDGTVDYPYLADNQYEIERQVFASRGYAVLEVNTRGTGGRGWAFEQAGDGRWGREVQDDYADGVRWAIQNGVAAAGHVCFYGTGYGAYSAMMAAARDAGLFQCVIGVGGVYDLPALMNGDKDAGRREPAGVIDELLFWGTPPSAGTKRNRISGAMMDDARRALEAVWAQDRLKKKLPPELQRAIGGNLDELLARSPVTHAASIKAKVLLIQQYMDRQAPEAQLSAMKKALRAAGNPARTYTIGDEDGYQWQGYFTLKTRTAAYKTLLTFLDKQIGH